MRIALVGQPNCGKSTLFNSVSGYKAVVSNFPGTTIEFISSKVRVNGREFELVDLPGIYSLSAPDTEERMARDYLFQKRPDVIINILDASVLSRSLELTLELLGTGIPMIVCLNMVDEARRKGIIIDTAKLSDELGVPVVPTVAVRGKGVPELFENAVEVGGSMAAGRMLSLSLDVEKIIEELEPSAEAAAGELGVPSRLLSVMLLADDDQFIETVKQKFPELANKSSLLRNELSESHGRPADIVISSEMHGLAMNLFERVARVKRSDRRLFREQIDRYIMGPYSGYFFLAATLVLFFVSVFSLGKHIEEPLLGWFENLTVYLTETLDVSTLFFTVLKGLIEGFSGGIGIVLPYLVPFLIGLSLLEDIGYLPRAAFLMDSIMHRVGLHGKSIVPFVLSYGCNVPAIMAVRVLERRRDRFVTAVLSTLIPCAARTTIIFALAAFYLGPLTAALLYVLNILVIAAVGTILTRIMPEVSPGMIIEIPAYRLPSLRSMAAKLWYRLREFIVIAWPFLIGGSIVLSLLDYYNLSGVINGSLAPFTNGLLGLPPQVGITLIFGILRKELTLIMLVQALGTNDFSAVMDQAQILVFTVFTLFYVPCLATLGVLRSVIGNSGMFFTLVVNTAIATAAALCFRALFAFA
ncbi:MAG: ferrous iron transport protein B [Desulfatiglandaceae bacterium]